MNRHFFFGLLVILLLGTVAVSSELYFPVSRCNITFVDLTTTVSLSTTMAEPYEVRDTDGRVTYCWTVYVVHGRHLKASLKYVENFPGEITFDVVELEPALAGSQFAPGTGKPSIMLVPSSIVGFVVTVPEVSNATFSCDLKAINTEELLTCELTQHLCTHGASFCVDEDTNCLCLVNPAANCETESHFSACTAITLENGKTTELDVPSLGNLPEDWTRDIPTTAHCWTITAPYGKTVRISFSVPLTDNNARHVQLLAVQPNALIETTEARLVFQTDSVPNALLSLRSSVTLIVGVAYNATDDEDSHAFHFAVEVGGDILDGCDSTEFSCLPTIGVSRRFVCDVESESLNLIEQWNCDNLCGNHNINVTATEEVTLEVRVPALYSYSCMWRATSESGTSVYIDIIEGSSNSNHLSLSEDPDFPPESSLVENFEKVAGWTYYTAGETLFIKVSSPVRGNERSSGMELRIRAENVTGHCGDTQALFAHHRTCLPTHAVCNGHADFADFSDEINCDVCGTYNIDVLVDYPASIVINTDLPGSPIIVAQGNISAPSVSTKVSRLDAQPHATDCIWRVRAPSESLLTVVVSKFSLVIDTGAWLRIDDGGVPVGNRTLLAVDSSADLPRRQTFYNVTSLWVLLGNDGPSELTQMSIEFSVEDGVVCGADQFSCPTHTQCVSLTNQCNGIMDCEDYGDELGCGRCSENQFDCIPKRPHVPCIDQAEICDKISDCPASNDEFMCPRCGDSRVFLNTGDVYTIRHRDRTDCVWAVTSPPGTRIRVTLQHPSGCKLILGNGPYSRYINSSVGFRTVDNTRISIFPFSSTTTRVTYPATLSTNGPALWIMKRLCRSEDGVWLQLRVFTDIDCPADLKRCLSGTTCVEPSAFCDGKLDCPEYKDEFGCGTCSHNEYSCLNGDGCISSQKLCNGVDNCNDQSDEYNCGPCGQSHYNLSDVQSVTVNSPAWPHAYPNNVECNFMFVAAPGNRVMVTFVTFDTEIGFDKLWLGNGLVAEENVIVELSGNMYPSAVASRQNLMYLLFKSDNIISKAGFSLRIEQQSEVSCNTDETLCDFRDLICVTKWNQEVCPEWDCSNSVFEASKENVQFKSQNYPLSYPSNLYCKWNVPSRDSSPYTRVEIESFVTEPDRDVLRVSGRSMLGDELMLEISGSTKVSSVIFNSTQLVAHFKTDSTVEQAGFHLIFTNVDPGLDSETWCDESYFNCNDGTCLQDKAKCDGFIDCQTGEDENSCASVYCPSFYHCSQTNSCIQWQYVCDGNADCINGDDELECDTKRCPSNCTCSYVNDKFHVLCHDGWDSRDVNEIARKTAALQLSGARTTLNPLIPGLFKQFPYLRSLSLSNSTIPSIPTGVFEGLANLTYLNISGIEVTEINMDIFSELQELQALVITSVPALKVITIGMDMDVNLKNLRTLVLIRGVVGSDPLVVKLKGFSPLPATVKAVVDDYKVCCYFSRDIPGFDIDNCRTTESQPPLNLCGSLMQNYGLRICMWVLGLSALFGNSVVIIWRLRNRASENNRGGDNARKRVHSFIVLNLAFSDFLMGVYMLIIAAADLHYGDGYSNMADDWRSSVACKVGGILSVLSCEASVFFVTLISVDCFLSIVFPFSCKRLQEKSAHLVSLTAWSSILCLSIVPTIVTDSDSDIYGLSDVCIGLPLTTKSTGVKLEPSDVPNPFGDGQSIHIASPTGQKPAWILSIVVFLGINLCCFLIVLVCYIAIFLTVRKSAGRVGRSQLRNREVKMAVKMALIVGTDFACWMPVIIVGILSQSAKLQIGAEVYSWIVVLVLPINSSLNPYLYTIYSSIIEQRSSKYIAEKSLNKTVKLQSRSNETLNSDLSNNKNI